MLYAEIVIINVKKGTLVLKQLAAGWVGNNPAPV